MKKLLFFITLIGLGVHTQAQNFEWAKNMGGASDDRGNCIVVDAAGNVYTTGFFKGTVDFDPGAGTMNLTSAGWEDIFVSKLDASGNFVWAKRMGATSDDRGLSIAVDSSGNVYTTGYFVGTADFDPGAGTFNLTSAGLNYDIFVSKLDASGNFVWAKRMGGTGSDIGNSIAIDSSGNVYTTGYFGGIADFDPGAGTFNLTSAGSSDIFVSKLDASGNFVWAKNMGGASDDRGNSIDLDSSGNVYTTGYFQGTADFDPGVGIVNLTAAGLGNNIFVSKLDASGNFVWAKNMGGTNDEKGSSITVDDFGNVYTTGYFAGTADFDPGAGTFNLTSAGGWDIFVSKLDTSGNFVWAKNMGGLYNDEGSSIVVDAAGNVYTTGYFNDIADFDPGVGIVNLISAAGFTSDIFVSKLDTSGNFVWAKSMGGINYDEGNSIAVDATGNVYTTGYFEGTADFDPGAGTVNLVAGFYDIFVSKLSQCVNTIGTDIQTACDSLTWIDGITYAASTNMSTFTIVGGAANGCDSVVTLNLTINNLNASYTSIDNGGGNYTFTNTSTGNFTQPHWAFGDGNTSVTTSPNHTFSANGTYVVVLTINDSTTNNTCMDYYLDTLVVTGVVNPVPCAAGFVMYPDGNNNVTVVNSSTGNNLSYFWDFGDGDTSTMQFPSHTYATAGPFYLCLTVNDGVSCVDMYCDSIGINGVLFNKQTGFSINVIAPPVVVGVSEQEALATEVIIYPNPTKDEFTIELKNNSSSPSGRLGGASVNIVNIEGKVVYSNAAVNSNKLTIDAAAWSKGVYSIQILNDNQTITKKIVKQ
ncbi:MAG: SBBP repeat-containing protein [Flavobacteriales bacterium]